MTREEAINEVKKAMPTMWKETKEALNVLISELAESDDEKIRKSLVEYFSCFKPTDMWNDTFSFSQIISYLEKQKDKMTAEEYENPELFQLKLKTKYANGYQDGLVQKEQKPAEWSEKDKDYYDAIIAKLEVTQDDAMLTDNQMDFLKSLPERLNLQPKQEWSEDDADFINMLILHFNYLINKGGDSVETYKSYIEGLKSLRPQPKQEWSEKDKEMLMKVEQIVLKHWNSLSDSFYHKYDDENQDAESCHNWLKSLPERFNLHPKQEWSDGDEKKLSAVISLMKSSRAVDPFYDKMCLEGWLKSLRPQSYKEIYQDAKHDLAIKFMNYLDENRPKDKMCLSNSECEDIDKVFKENDWAKIVRYIEKCKPQWKPSKEQIGALNYAYCELFKRKDVEHNILGLLQKLIDDFRELL